MPAWTNVLHAATVFDLNDRKSPHPCPRLFFAPTGRGYSLPVGFLQRQGDCVLNFALSRPAVRAQQGEQSGASRGPLAEPGNFALHTMMLSICD
jgi:hypothetical protein